MLTRKLEIPYNFDKNLITALSIIDPKGDHIHCIYVAPFRADYEAAKKYHTTETYSVTESQIMPRNEYEEHIRLINETFPGKLMLLLQRSEDSYLMPKEEVKYYIDLGFKNFCIGNINQAKIIRMLDPTCIFTASIAMKLSPEEIHNNQGLREYLDAIVLWFPYNRNFEWIQNLPDCFKYILLVNCHCNIHCQGSHHWFATEEQELRDLIQCPNKKAPSSSLWSKMIIRPTDMKMFEPYISYFKLQGREYSTPQIIEDFILYTTDRFSQLQTAIDEDLYMKKTEEEIATLEQASITNPYTTYRKFRDAT